MFQEGKTHTVIVRVTDKYDGCKIAFGKAE